MHSLRKKIEESSQIRIIIFLCDKEDKYQPIYWSSQKPKRVTIFVLGSEVMAAVDAFYMAYASKDLEKMLMKRIPINMFKDSLSLFGVIKKETETSEKRFIIDIAFLKNSYKNKEIQHSNFLRLKFNPDDGLKNSEMTLSYIA